MASVIGVVIALLILFVLLVIILLYAYKKQKLCFKGKFIHFFENLIFFLSTTQIYFNNPFESRMAWACPNFEQPGVYDILCVLFPLTITLQKLLLPVYSQYSLKCLLSSLPIYLVMG